MTVTTGLDGLPRAVTGWATRRSLSPGALAGIALTCGICAAAWFSAGDRPDTVTGSCLLAAGYLAQRLSRMLAAPGVPGGDSGRAPGGVPGSTPSGTSGGAWSGTSPGAWAGASPGAWAGAPGGGWLAEAGAAVTGCAVCAGLAWGVPPSRQAAAWVLAAGAVSILAAGRTAACCRRLARPAAAGRWARWAWPAGWARGGGWPPAGAVAAAVVVAPVCGPSAALIAVLVCALAVAAAGLAGPDAAGADPQREAEQGGAEQGGPRSAAVWPWMVAACRGDGRLGRWLGGLLRGQVRPLPPTVAGVAATLVLAALGMRDLSGVLLLAPVAALLLAMAGAGHPHDGPLDWLVPAVLQAGEYVYLTALGFATGVPGPVTFALVSAIAVANRAAACGPDPATARPCAPAGPQGPHAPAGPDAPAGPGQSRGGPGWEARLLIVGVAACLGSAALACAVLTAYLWLTLAWSGLSGWPGAAEPGRSGSGEGEPW